MLRLAGQNHLPLQKKAGQDKKGRMFSIISAYYHSGISAPLDFSERWCTVTKTCPGLITYFPMMSLSGMHQDALAFTLQKILKCDHRGHLHLYLTLSTPIAKDAY